MKAISPDFGRRSNWTKLVIKKDGFVIFSMWSWKTVISAAGAAQPKTWRPAHKTTIAGMQLLTLWGRKEAGCHKPQSQNTLLS